MIILLKISTNPKSKKIDYSYRSIVLIEGLVEILVFDKMPASQKKSLV